MRQTTQTKETVQLFLFGKGQLFGEERFVKNEQGASYSAVCASLEGEVMRISSIEFQRKVMNIAETAEMIRAHTGVKEDKITQKQYSQLMVHYVQKHSMQKTQIQAED